MREVDSIDMPSVGSIEMPEMPTLEPVESPDEANEFEKHFEVGIVLLDPKRTLALVPNLTACELDEQRRIRTAISKRWDDLGKRF